MEKLGDRLKKLRAQKGSSIAETAHSLKISPSTYREWEYGREIKGEPYERIANYFNVSLNYLLTGQKLTIETSLEEIERHIKVIRSTL